MRYFNTAGPCQPAAHYMLPALERLPEAWELVEQGQYFVVHAPRQTGKSTTLMALAEALTRSGKFAALHFTCEEGEAAGDDYGAAQRAILEQIYRMARLSLPLRLRPPVRKRPASQLSLLSSVLTTWAERCPRPLVLIFDEIDALRGEGMRAVLRQLRAGYPTRPHAFPHAVILCGLRDVRDYKAASGGDPGRLGTSSPFNVKVESMRLGDFTKAEVAALYRQHTQETQQAFSAEAVDKAFELTQGQPWLVNALAREIIQKMKVRSPSSITAEHIDEAKERLILARATHLDSLVARLQESRVKRILEPVIAGTIDTSTTYQDDFEYVRDLGLVASNAPTRVANPIYREVIVRILAASAEQNCSVDPRSFVLKDGRLDMDRLLLEFAGFWREHGEALAGGIAYPEAAPQLVIMAFLHRVVNGGGYVDREYGIGRGRIDILVRWPYASSKGKRLWQREALELKVWRQGRPDPRREGLAQLDGYLEQVGLKRGYLVIFDCHRAKPGLARRRARATKLKAALTPKRRAAKVLAL